ncbi:MAG: hypothetical protein GXY58_08235 [Planctomycetaceae bacterium]|nr:hypothetical protein [Planctomycetaceae bacterium]
MVDPNIMDDALLITRLKTIRELHPTFLLDASYGVLNAAGNPCLDSELVASWVAKVGGVTFTQPLEAEQPRWLECGIGNRPALLFDGSDDFLVSRQTAALRAALSSQSGTIVAVTQMTVANGAVLSCVISGYDGGVTARAIGFGYGSTAKTYTRASVDGPVVSSGTGSTVVGTNKAVATWTTNEAATEWEHYVDAVKQTMTGGGVGNDGKWLDDITNWTRCAVGSYSEGLYPFPGRIALIAGWNTRL